MGSFESFCVLEGVIFCFDVGLRGLRLVSVVVEHAFCDVLVDFFLRFCSFLVIFLGVRGLLILDSESRWFCTDIPWCGG